LHSETWAAIDDELASAGIRVLPLEDRPERQRELRQRFMDEIFPVLTPLAVDPSHPFPYISDLSLSLAVTVHDPVTGEQRFARIKVPPVLPRMWEVAPRTYVLLERVIAANLDVLFPGMEVLGHHLFRVTRNADLSIEEDEADDLLLAIEEELRRRRFGNVRRTRPTTCSSRTKRSCVGAASGTSSGSRSSGRCPTRRARSSSRA
jgi:polyphosphate kinase